MLLEWPSVAGRIGSAIRRNTVSVQVQEIAAVVTCKYDYKAAGVVDLGTISIRRCSGRGVVEFLTEGHRHEWSLCRT